MTAWSEDHFIAGDLALDFANTVYRRTPVLGPDLFDSADDLVAWLAYAKLLPTAGRSPGGFADAEDALREARALREWLWTIFGARIDGGAPASEALAGLLGMARRGIGVDVAVDSDGGTTPLTVEGGLVALALRGLALALSPSPRPMHACDRCGWFFFDTSRGRRRRWCSMKTCGNQAKAARHRSAGSA